MNIKFKNIDIRNFLSIGSSKVSLDDSGYTIVSGVNNNPADSAKSNGSGKSSIFEAISWCLCGETVRGSKDIVNAYSDNGAYVSLEFSIDNNDFIITRTKEYKPGGTSLKIFINGEDKSGKGIRDTEKLLQEYLPDLTSSLIGSVIILGQGMPQRFSNNTPSGRKEVLEKLSKSDYRIYELKDRIAKRKAELSNRDSDLTLEANTEETIIRSSEETINSYINKINSLPSVESMQLELNKNKEELSKVTASLAGLKENSIGLSNSVTSYTELLLGVKDELNDKIKEAEHRYDDEISKDTDKLNAVNIEITKISSDISHISKDIDKINNMSDTCPTCGRKLDGFERPSTKELEESLNSKKEELNNLTKDRSFYNDLLFTTNTQKSNLIEDIKGGYSKKISEFTELLNSSKNSLQSTNRAIEDQERALRNLENAIRLLENDINEHDSKKAMYEESIKELKDKISTSKDKLLYINNKREELKEHLDILNKMNTVVTRDFRGILLTSVIEYINTKAKEYSMVVFDKDSIEFSLDGNNINISYDGRDYSNLSGGERQKVDLIVQFSLRDMLCKHINFSSNIIVFDELFDNLDSVGCERVLNLISTKLNDVESIYIITHHTEIPIPHDNTITVTKGVNGISVISKT